MNEAKKRLVIIDGNAIIHRAYHAIPPLNTKGGEVVNAVYGFTSMLLKVLSDLKPDFLTVTFDMAGGTFRDAVYEKYKATRVKADQDLYDQIPLVHEMVSAFEIPIFEREGFEADDVIGTIVKKMRGKGFEVVVVSGDRDLLQLATDDVHIYLLKKGLSEFEMYDPGKVVEKFGFEPVRMIDYKAIAGDSSDNIPGVKGIGEVGAKDLLAKVGGIDEIYARLDELEGLGVKKSVIEKLRDDEKGARMSKELATIHCDVPEVEFDLEEATVHAVNKEKVLPLFQRFEFVSLLRRLPGVKSEEVSASSEEKNSAKKSSRKKIKREVVLVSEKNIEEFFGEMDGVKEFCAKEIISGKNILDGDFKGFIFITDTKIFFAEFIHLNLKEKEKIFDIFLDEKKVLIGHDLKQIVKVFEVFKKELRMQLFDIMIASYILNSSTRAHDLRSIVLRELAEDLPETPKETLFGIDVQLVGDECGYFHEIFEQYSEALQRQGDLKLFHEIEMALIPVLAAMEVAGVALDVPMLKQLSKEVSEAIEKVTKQIWEEAGEEFNVASSVQLREILFEKMGLVSDGIKKGKTGYSTAASELEKLRGTSPIIEMIEQHRELSKLQNTYIDVLPLLVNKNTGRIHGLFNQAVAATGRLSSSDPNLQNIPIRSDLGRQIRRAFIAEKGNVLVAADYSQVELRIVAAMADEKRMIEIFERGEDIHRATAAILNDVPLEEVTKEMRSAAKTVNFGVLYGQGAYGLAGQTGMTQWEAKEFIANYFEKFQGVKKYFDGILKEAKKTGYVETLFGRKRFVPELLSKNFQLRAAGERMAINMPIQGTAADMMKMAMIEVYRELQKLPEWERGEVKMILQVHDEIVVEVREDLGKKVGDIMKNAMERVVKLAVPIVVEVSVGERWGDLK